MPLTWWILSSAAAGTHGHDSHPGHHDETESHEVEKATTADSEVVSKDDGEGEEEGGEEEAVSQSSKSQKDESGDDSDQDTSPDTPDSSDDESYVVDEDEKNVRKHVPDAKGGAKLRLESKQGKKQGDFPGRAANDKDNHVDIVSRTSQLELWGTKLSPASRVQTCRRTEYSIGQARRSEQYRYQALHRPPTF